MSKIEGGGCPIEPPSRLRVTIFSSRLLGLKMILAALSCILFKFFKEGLIAISPDEDPIGYGR